MIEELDVEALSGTEIKDDILAQVKRKLESSCDLRSTDCYGQGYSGKIEIHLKLYSVDTTSIDLALEIVPKGEPPVSTEETIVTRLEIDEKLEISQELDIDAVRARIKEQEIPPPPVEAEENPLPQRLKRRYTRRTANLEHPAVGGAVDIDTSGVKS